MAVPKKAEQLKASGPVIAEWKVSSVVGSGAQIAKSLGGCDEHTMNLGQSMMEVNILFTEKMQKQKTQGKKT